MKYLKCFNESLNSNGYDKIDTITLQKMIDKYKSKEDFENNEIIQIEDAILPSRTGNSRYYILDKSRKACLTYTIWNDIVVYKLSDSWYCVRIINNNHEADTYRCDQIDGLLNCLKDNYKH